MTIATETGMRRANTMRRAPAARGASTFADIPQTRSAVEFAAAQRHSRLVRFLKLGLPLAALFGTGFFAAATVLSGTGAPVPQTAPVTLDDGRIVMANPKMEGFTSDKRPYKLVADRAIQASAKSSIVELQKISAALPFGKNATATLSAGTGLFDNSSNQLDLKDSISLVTSDGMIASLSSARINVTNSEMSTQSPVEISTSGAHLTADSMTVKNGGAVIVFENHVRLNIDANKLKQAGPADGQDSQ